MIQYLLPSLFLYPLCPKPQCNAETKMNHNYTRLPPAFFTPTTLLRAK